MWSNACWWTAGEPAGDSRHQAPHHRLRVRAAVQGNMSQPYPTCRWSIVGGRCGHMSSHARHDSGPVAGALCQQEGEEELLRDTAGTFSFLAPECCSGEATRSPPLLYPDNGPPPPPNAPPSSHPPLTKALSLLRRPPSPQATSSRPTPPTSGLPASRSIASSSASCPSLRTVCRTSRPSLPLRPSSRHSIIMRDLPPDRPTKPRSVPLSVCTARSHRGAVRPDPDSRAGLPGRNAHVFTPPRAAAGLPAQGRQGPMGPRPDQVREHPFRLPGNLFRLLTRGS